MTATIDILYQISMLQLTIQTKQIVFGEDLASLGLALAAEAKAQS